MPPGDLLVNVLQAEALQTVLSVWLSTRLPSPRPHKMKKRFHNLMAFDFADNASLAEPESAALRSGRRK